MDKTAQECRDHATQLRLWAEKQPDRLTRQHTLLLAESWELMARSQDLLRVRLPPVRATSH